MSKELAARVQRIKPSPTLTISARAEQLIAEGKNIINMSLGEPDFDTPDFIKEAAIKAIRDGLTKYTAVEGTVGLKQAIIKKFARENGLHYELSQIIASCGAKHSLYNLAASVLNEGDEAIILAPYWTSYADIVKLADGVPVVINTDLEQHFKITAEQLKAHITPKTRLLLLNSPSNPTGIAYTAEELRALSRVLLNYPNVIIASDDIYEHTIWSSEPFANILMVCPELYDRCVVINGVSKAYAMTGWRLGYAAGPAYIIAAMKKIQSQCTSNPASIVQAAAEAALNGDQSCTRIMTQAYKERHDFILGELQKMPGIECRAGEGTFYCFPSIKELLKKTNSTQDDLGFAEYLLNEVGIAVVPGSAFGAPGYIRISYATSMEKIKEAMARMHAGVAKLVSSVLT